MPPKTNDLKRETLAHTRESEYFSVPGLRTLTGLAESSWDFALVKELLDNALDAVDDLPKKRADVLFDGDMLQVRDNGSGISPQDLDGVYDFTKYISNKHDYRTATRGMQGNALKTVIGICQLRGYDLRFVVGPHVYRYVINKTLLDAGFVKFDKRVEPNPNSHASSVIISGLWRGDGSGRVCLTDERIRSHLTGLHLSNPDVTFKFNDETFNAVTAAKKHTNKTFIHWYDFAAFNQLLQAVVVKDPDRTVKDFCPTFSGLQRVLSKLELTKNYKRLSEFNEDPVAVLSLLRELKTLTKPPSPKIVEGMLTGDDAFMSMFSDDSDKSDEGGEK
ncbi:MAG: hypothetical protein WCI87_06975 [Euryarchaeota archaeon]